MEQQVGFGAERFPSRKLLHDDNNFEIRVLILPTPSETSEPINCRFEIRKYPRDCSSHGSPPPQSYHALSYCWGSQPASERVLVEGVPFLPTQNLHEFFRNVISSDEIGNEVAIWIDAICINQNDEEEKVDQISIMREIYQNAESTLIWLGSGDADCEQGLKMVPNLCNLANDIYDTLKGRDYPVTPMDAKEAKWRLVSAFFKDVQTNSIKTNTLKSWSEDNPPGHNKEVERTSLQNYYDNVAALYKPDGDLKPGMGQKPAEQFRQQLFHHVVREYGIEMSQLAHITKILSLSWYRRVWIVQELSTSRQPFMVYGQEIVRWDDFMLAVRLYNCLDSANEKSFETQHGHQRSYHVVTLDNQRDEFRRGDKPQLLDLVQLFRPLEATKPEDKIIGLQGLAASPFKVDYTLGTARFYIDFAYSNIQNSSSLNILLANQCRHNEIGGGTAHLPSWVPDWSRSLESVKWNSQYASNPKFEVHRYDASAGASQAAVKLEGGRNLQLDVCFVDSISVVRKHPSYLLDYRSDKGWDFEARATAKDEIPLAERLYKTNEAIIDGLKFHTRCRSRITLLMYNFSVLRPLTFVEDYPTGENQFDAYYNLFVPWGKSEISPTYTKIFRLGRFYMFILAPLQSLFVAPFGRHIKVMWIVFIAWAVTLCATTYLATLSYGVFINMLHRLGNTSMVKYFSTAFANRKPFSANGFWWALIQKYLPFESSNPQDFNVIEGLRMFQRDLRHEQLARTQKGYSGYVNCEVVAGDAVVIIPGADMPFVLREMDEKGRWKLLGRAQIHGMMHGEVLEGRELKRITLI